MRLWLSFFLLLGALKAHACTGLRLKAKDGSMVHGRTLEFGTELMPSIAVVPRGYSFTGTTPLGKGLTYISKYAAVGAMVFEDFVIADGINEQGLSVGVFYFPGYASYTPATSENQSMGLSPLEFPNWILTQFATVEEVKAALSTVAVVPTRIKSWGNICPPFHYIVYDKKGGCLVIEPLNEKLITYDNPLGVFTNSPSFDWQMTYLRNFINLRSVNAPSLKEGDLVLAPFGQGSGLVGLPGDFTPPSRFVRAAIFSYTAIPSNTAEEAIFQLFHILNQFDIPIGSIREVIDGVVHTDYTMLTCAKDPKALKYYFKTYQDQAIKVVDLKKMDLKAATIKRLTTSGKQAVVDISSQLK